MNVESSQQKRKRTHRAAYDIRAICAGSVPGGEKTPFWSRGASDGVVGGAYPAAAAAAIAAAVAAVAAVAALRGTPPNAATADSVRAEKRFEGGAGGSNAHASSSRPRFSATACAAMAATALGDAGSAAASAAAGAASAACASAAAPPARAAAASSLATRVSARARVRLRLREVQRGQGGLRAGTAGPVGRRRDARAERRHLLLERRRASPSPRRSF